MSTLDKKTRTVGSGRIYVNRRNMGRADGLTFAYEVEKLISESNVGLEFTEELILPILTRMKVSGNFGEISPNVANTLLGRPGFFRPKLDYRLPGKVDLTEDHFTEFTPVQYREYVSLIDNLKGRPVWNKLLYEPVYAEDTPAPPTEILAVNDEAPGAITGYAGITMSANKAGAPTTYGVIGEASVFELYDTGVAPGSDTITITWRDNPNAAEVDSYRLWFARFDIVDGEYVQITPWEEVTGKLLIAKGTETEEIEANTTNLPALGASYVGPVVVNSLDSAVPVIYDEGVDYIVDPERRQIKRLAAGAMTAFETVECVYYYNIEGMVEIPFDATGDNPECEVMFEHLYPDKESRLIVALFGAQLRSNVTVALGDRDWMNIPFEFSCLNKAEEYPDYGFGYWRLVGPITNRVHKGGGATDIGEYNGPWG